MGLELRRDKNHNLRSKWWYGRYMIDGKRRFVNLGVEVRGSTPKNLREQGNMAFECSRTLAAAKLKDLLERAQNKKTAAHHLQELYEIKAGEEISQISLTKLGDEWDLLPVKKKRSPLRTSNQLTSIRQFQKFIKADFPQAKLMSQITRRMALGWMKNLDDQGMAGSTYNTKLSLLKGIFEKLGPEAGVISNPFRGIPYHEKNTMHRQPFTQEELTEILNHCDKLIRPVVLTAMCTAMRRGDCAMLKWESIDLEGCFISVKTSKTGELAEIPLFPLLRSELETLPRKGIYVFPEVAEMYKTNLMGLTWRFQKALKDAKIENTSIARDDAMQRASVKDFHSFRTTWITMALSAGVPMELVRRVTGHSTVDVVLKHYFRPDKEAFRTALESAMPKMLTGGGQEEKKAPQDALRWLVEHKDELQKEEFVAKVAKIAAGMAA